MTDADGRSGHGAVRWLTAQAALFGVVAALLGVVANAMFLEAYGARWLPVTYILIGAGGAVVSALVARSAQSFDLVRIATVVLGTAAAVILAAWVVARDGEGAWVSGPLLVLFPILIQLGFVFVGAQAGRILDIAGIKGRFPRIVAGFPVGAIAGGLLAAPLVDLLGGTEGLLLATGVAQAGFAALVLVTGVRYAPLLALPPAPGPAGRAATTGLTGEPGTGMGRLLRSRFVGLLLAYQVLSAVASQLSDYLVFDRAAARYPVAEDLARFLAGYTALMNVVSIAFLVLVAGPLLRRFGLRFGVAANPDVLAASALAMVVALAATGGGSLALLAAVSAARILDIALTDGTTRTSINAMYQVLPERTRLSAQATIEGMGVPVAIGASGVLVLGLNALSDPLPVLLGATVLVCAAWVWTARLLHRAYGPALVDALRQRRMLVPPAELEGTPDDLLAAERLLESPDPRAARLGLELVAALAPAALLPELAVLSNDPRPEVRLSALEALASAGDPSARLRLPDEVRRAALAEDPAVRVRAAFAARVLDDEDRVGVLDRLLPDDAVPVRAAALDAVRGGDAALVPAVLGALDAPTTRGAAGEALGRLGDAVLPALEGALRRSAGGGAGSSATRRVLSLLRACPGVTASAGQVLLRWVDHPDREVGHAVLVRLARPGPATGAAAGVLDGVLSDDLTYAARVLGALVTLDDDRPPGADLDADLPLRRALTDELVLARDRVAGALLARHGSDLVGPAVAGFSSPEGASPLAVEALEVVLGRRGASGVTPVLELRADPAARLRRLLAATGARAVDGGAAAVVRDLVEDRGDVWRSPWLRACAVRAAGPRRERMPGLDLRPARALGHPVVDEELARLAR